MIEVIKSAPQQRSLVMPEFLKGGGEASNLIFELDWSLTPLGPIESWSSCLRTTLGIILHSGFPQFLFWGKELICFYNDVFRPSLGVEGKHPVIGKKGREVWPEIWEFIGPLIEKVMTKGEHVKFEDQLVPFYRNGKLEDIYWTFSYSPVYDDDGRINGVFVTYIETTEKVNYCKQIEESKNQLEFAIEATELGTWDYNPINNQFIINDRLKEWFGLQPADRFELSRALDAIVEKDRDRVIEAIENTLQYTSGGLYDIEYSIIHPLSKNERFVRAKGRAWFNEDNIAYRFNGTLQDITERKKAETERQKLASIVEASHEFIGLSAPDGKVQYVNPAALQMLGWNNLDGKKIFDCIYHEDLPLAEELLKELFEKHHFSKEIRFVNENTEIPFWVLWNAFTINDGSGEVIGLATVSANIADRRMIDEALKESEERFRTMAEDSEILIAVADETGNVTYFSKAWIDLTGRAMDDLLKFGWVDLVHPEDKEQYVNLYVKAFKNRKSFTGEFRILNKEGEYRWIFAKVPPRFRTDGSFAGFISSCIDITEHKEAEKALELKNVQLLRINNDLDNFIYTASHDLKAPISNLEGLMNVIVLEGEFNDEQMAILRMMKLSIERFKNTIRDLTEISKIQRIDEYDPEIVSFAEILAEVKLDIRELIDKYNPGIECCFDVPEIKFSRKNLRSIIYNLFSNALKYSSSNRKLKIAITAKREDWYVVLKVSDNGLGINKENQNKVFGMFKRAHQHVEGSGIGLYMIKRMIDNAGGRIEVDSEVDVGTTFSVYFKIH